MADNPRIEDLRRRIQKDPASIAFAQLAEEYRRAGLFEEAVQVCRTGLGTHPGYLSARVTLGRSLLELNQLEDARRELETVLKSAPENLAAIRGLAEIHHRRGDLPEALTHYRSALALAKNDPELEQTVEHLSHELSAASQRPPSPEPLVASATAGPAAPERPAASELESAFPQEPRPTSTAPLEVAPDVAQPGPAIAIVRNEPDATIEHPEAAPSAFGIEPMLEAQEDAMCAQPAASEKSGPAPTEEPAPAAGPARQRAQRTVAALEQYLDAIHVSRARARS
jgi:hypothetical protein